MLGEEDEAKQEGELNKVLDEMESLFKEKEIAWEISLNASSGSKSFSTLRLQGQIKNRKMRILVDSGSTHSFIDAGLVK